MWSDAALRGRVDGEDASVCTASHVPEHPASAFIDGAFEDLWFPTVQERGIEVVAGSVAVGEHKRLLGVQGVLREGVEFGGVPVNFDLYLGDGYGICRVFTLSAGCEGNVGLVVIGVGVLGEAQVNAHINASQKYAPFRPSNSGTSIGHEFVSVEMNAAIARTTWDRRPPGHWTAGRSSWREA